jgi:hypothetical protein
MKNNYIIYMAFIAIILSSCKPEQKKVGDSYSYLSEEQLNKTPYFNNPAFDTLIFISNKGDTLIFAKVKSVSYFNIFSINNDPEDDSRAYSEVRHNTYQTLKGNGKFEVRHVLNDGRSSLPYFSITFNQYNIEFHEYTLANINYPTYLDSTFVNNKYYYNLTRYTLNNGFENIAVTFVNNAFGLFHINELKQSTIWDLIK